MAVVPAVSDEWTRALRVHTAAVLSGEIGRELQRAPTVEPVDVSQLVDLRRAYWRTVQPVAVGAERTARMRDGVDWHARLGLALAPIARREVPLRRGGIRGRVDLFADRVTEFKTTAFPPDAGRLVADRPGYFEQLGFYCALAQRSEARLILVGTAAPDSVGGVSLGVYDLRFDDLDGIWREAEERAALLRAAWALGTPRQLPACAWFGVNCEYRKENVCTCTGLEPDGRFAIGDSVRGFAPNPTAAEEVRSALARAGPADGHGPVAHRFWDLLVPRRVYFDRLHGASESGRAALPEPTENDRRWWGEKRWWKDRIREALEAAAPGSLSLAVAGSGEPDEPIECHDGAPYLMRVGRGPLLLDPQRLLVERPQYFLELGLRAAAVGSSVGRLILVHPQAARPEHRVMVFEVEFDPLERFDRIAIDRREALARAIETRDPSTLPACYEWMFADCPYRAECG